MPSPRPMPLRVFIVDDEPLAREGLELRLETIADVDVAESFGRAADALDAIETDAPDLLLLDVKMPGLSGFDMLDALPPGERPAVIFVTAHDEYAVRAFEEHAVDYLLKPVSAERLASSVERVRGHHHLDDVDTLKQTLRSVLNTLDASAGSASGVGRRPSPDRIAVRTRGRVVMVRPGEIDCVQGAGDYVKLYVEDDTYLHRETMAGMDERLAPHGFQRIHRSTIVNLDRVQSLTTDAHGAYYVCLENGPRLKLSRSYRDAFEAAIGTSF